MRQHRSAVQCCCTWNQGAHNSLSSPTKACCISPKHVCHFEDKCVTAVAVINWTKQDWANQLHLSRISWSTVRTEHNSSWFLESTDNLCRKEAMISWRHERLFLGDVTCFRRLCPVQSSAEASTENELTFLVAVAVRGVPCRFSGLRRGKFGGGDGFLRAAAAPGTACSPGSGACSPPSATQRRCSARHPGPWRSPSGPTSSSTPLRWWSRIRTGRRVGIHCKKAPTASVYLRLNSEKVVFPSYRFGLINREYSTQLAGHSVLWPNCVKFKEASCVEGVPCVKDRPDESSTMTRPSLLLSSAEMVENIAASLPTDTCRRNISGSLARNSGRVLRLRGVGPEAPWIHEVETRIIQHSFNCPGNAKQKYLRRSGGWDRQSPRWMWSPRWSGAPTRSCAEAVPAALSWRPRDPAPLSSHCAPPAASPCAVSPVHGPFPSAKTKTNNCTVCQWTCLQITQSRASYGKCASP